jgi:hypothetical protein
MKSYSEIFETIMSRLYDEWIPKEFDEDLYVAVWDYMYVRFDEHWMNINEHELYKIIDAMNEQLTLCLYVIGNLYNPDVISNVNNVITLKQTKLPENSKIIEFLTLDNLTCILNEFDPGHIQNTNNIEQPQLITETKETKKENKIYKN